MASSRGPASHAATSLVISPAWIGLAWIGLAWIGLAWIGLAWIGLAWALPTRLAAQGLDEMAEDEDLAPLELPPSPPPPVSTAPRAELPQRLSFLHRRTLSEGAGRLEGHVDVWLEAGTFELTRGTATDDVTVTRAVTWRHQAPGVCEVGREEGRVEDALWLSPDVPAGATVELLGERRVLARELTLDVGNAAIPALLAEAHGERTRDDALGRFHVLYSDEVWLDASTGLLLRRERTEIGESEDASYEEHDVLWVTDAAFLPERARSSALPLAVCPGPRQDPSPWVRLGIPFAALLLSGLGLAWLRRWLAAKERVQP